MSDISPRLRQLVRERVQMLRQRHDLSNKEKRFRVYQVWADWDGDSVPRNVPQWIKDIAREWFPP